MGVSEH